MWPTADGKVGTDQDVQPHDRVGGGTTSKRLGGGHLGGEHQQAAGPVLGRQRTDGQGVGDLSQTVGGHGDPHLVGCGGQRGQRNPVAGAGLGAVIGHVGGAPP